MSVKERGFASEKDPEKRREKASIGGKAAHASGHARHWDADSARAAGKKGLHIRMENKKAKKPDDHS